MPQADFVTSLATGEVRDPILPWLLIHEEFDWLVKKARELHTICLWGCVTISMGCIFEGRVGRGFVSAQDRRFTPLFTEVGQAISIQGEWYTYPACELLTTSVTTEIVRQSAELTLRQRQLRHAASADKWPTLHRRRRRKTVQR